jgi:hypothetical protein
VLDSESSLHFPATRSHIAARCGELHTFSRDCPAYYVELPSAGASCCLPNHFASKGSDATGNRRKVQAAAAADQNYLNTSQFGTLSIP